MGGLQHEQSVTCLALKLNQIVCFMMLNTFGKLLNMIRSKNTWKICDQKPKQRFQNLTCDETSVPSYQLKGSQGMILDALER